MRFCGKFRLRRIPGDFFVHKRENIVHGFDGGYGRQWDLHVIRFYQKRAGYYRWQVLVRGPEPRLLLQEAPLQLPARAGLQVEVTTDPVNLL